MYFKIWTCGPYKNDLWVHQSKPSTSYIPCDIADKFWNDMCRKGPEQLCFLKLPSITNPYALIMLVARAGRSNMGGSNPGDNFPDYGCPSNITLFHGQGTLSFANLFLIILNTFHVFIVQVKWASKAVHFESVKISRWQGSLFKVSYLLCKCVNVQSAESIINLLLPQCDYDCFRCTRRQIGGVRVECTPVDVW